MDACAGSHGRVGVLNEHVYGVAFTLWTVCSNNNDDDDDDAQSSFADEGRKAPSKVRKVYRT